MVALHIAQDEAADALLSSDPFAVLIGLTLDQQYPMEHAFRGPRKIADRFGEFSVTSVAGTDPDDFVARCSVSPAIHRFPASMAARVQQIAAIVIDEYDGDTAAIWTRDEPDAATVHRRLTALPGWGDQKARIMLALLAKQLGVRLDGWERVAGDYSDDNTRSVADVVDAQSLQAVRDFKKAAKAAAKADKTSQNADKDTAVTKSPRK